MGHWPDIHIKLLNHQRVLGSLGFSLLNYSDKHRPKCTIHLQYKLLGECEPRIIMRNNPLVCSTMEVKFKNTMTDCDAYPPMTSFWLSPGRIRAISAGVKTLVQYSWTAKWIIITVYINLLYLQIFLESISRFSVFSHGFDLQPHAAVFSHSYLQIYRFFAPGALCASAALRKAIESCTAVTSCPWRSSGRSGCRILHLSDRWWRDGDLPQWWGYILALNESIIICSIMEF